MIVLGNTAVFADVRAAGDPALSPVVAPGSSLIDPGRDPQNEAAWRQRSLGPWGLLVPLELIALFAFLTWAFRRKRVEWAVSLCLVAFSLLLLLSLVEAGLRRAPAVWALKVKVRSGCYDSNPRDYFKPSQMAGHPESSAFCSDGFERDWAACDADTRERDRGRLRILALGDSFTNGVGVFTEDRWPAVLERLLVAGSKGGPPPRVVNCGFISLDAEQVAERYFERRERHDPQVVVYAFVLNDVSLRSETPERPSEIGFQLEDRTSYFLRVQADPLWSGLVAESALARFAVERYVTWRTAQATERMYRDSYTEANRAALDAAFRRVEAMADDCRRRGSRFLVAVWPLFYRLERYPFREAHALILSELKARGVEVVDMLPVFEGQESSRYQVHPTDFHPNELAHRLFAAQLSRELARRGWLKVEGGAEGR